MTAVLLLAMTTRAVAQEQSSAAAPTGPTPPGAAAPTPAPGPAGVEPPELVAFVEATYPSAAKDAGRTADVDVRVDIDAEGSVTAAEVVTPVGDGFDEAALAAVRGFRFRPARRDGRAVPSRIVYRYRFTLDAPVAAPAGASTLRGIVRIREGEGLPLGNVRIVLRSAEGATRETRTDAGGRFSLPDLSSGTWRVALTADGFERVEVDEVFDAAEEREVVYRLPVGRAIDEVIVLGEREDPPVREVTRRTMSAAELSRIPGTGGDALKALTSLPGFARPPAIAGLLIVRGSAPEETGVFVDGTEVPIVYHFGGLSSVVPTELLDHIDFYPSNFGVRFGRYTGGVIDVGLKSPDVSCRRYGKDTGETDCFHALGQVDLIDVRALVSGPIGRDWSFAIGARRSWVDLWLSAVLEGSGTTSVTAAPVYYDYQAMVEHRPNARERLSLRVFGSDDRTRLVFDEPGQAGIGGELGLSTRFIRGQALYDARPHPDVELRAMLAAGYTGTAFNAGNNLDFDFDFVPVEWRTEVGWQAARWAKLRAGLDWQVIPTTVGVRAPDPLRPGEQAPGTLVTARTLRTDSELTQHRPASWAEVELRPHPRLLLAPGLRFDYTRQTGDLTADPRVHARLALAGPDLLSRERSAQTVLKAGVGLFHQPPQLQETDEVFGTPGVESERALHLSLGVEQRLTRQITVGLDGYTKLLDELVSRRADATGSFEYENEGRGRVVGGELLARYEPDDFFFGWLAYSLTRSTRDDGPGTDETLFQYDQTHNLTALASFKLGRGWEVGARFRLLSGSPYTPVADRVPAIYAADGTEYVPLNGEPFSERLPVFHQLDVRIDKRWQFERWALGVYLDVQNVYNRQAREAIAYSYDFSQNDYQLGLPILPSLGVRGEL